MENIRWINTEEYLRNKNGDKPDPKINPVDRFKEVVAEFGPPDFLNPNPKGMAWWDEDTLKKRGKIWQSIMLIDEALVHDSPEPHYDFLYTFYKHGIPKNKVCDVIGISDSITYDKLKHELMARCHFLGANIATLTLAVKVSNGEMSLEQAKANYGPYIMSTATGKPGYDPDAIEKFQQYLSNNREIDRQSGGNGDDYYYKKYRKYKNKYLHLSRNN
jgi:hypothetical protein